MERDSIVFYRSFYEAIRLQPKKIQADIYNAVLDYAFNGAEPNISPAAMSIFYLIKPQIDANNKKFEDGKKGGRPRKAKTIGYENDAEEKTTGFENSNKTETNGFENNVKNSVQKKPNEECRMSNVNEECRMSNVNVNDNEKHNYQLIADMYNATCVSFPKCTMLSEGRKKAIKARLNKYSCDDFQRLFELAEESDFLKGANKNNWSASFDWLIKDTNMAKVLDGNYANRSKTQDGTGNPFMDLYNEMG